MSVFKAKQLGFLAAGLTFLALSATPGCSDEDTQAAPSAGTGGDEEDAGAGGRSGSGNTAGAGAVNSGGDAGSDAVPGGGETAGAGGDGGESPGATGGTGGGGPTGGTGGTGGMVSCDGPNGCYACAPVTAAQFANHCVSGGCPATYDNSKLTAAQKAKLGTL